MEGLEALGLSKGYCMERDEYFVGCRNLLHGRLSADKDCWVGGYRIFDNTGQLIGLQGRYTAKRYSIDISTIYSKERAILPECEYKGAAAEYDWVIQEYVRRYIQFTYDILENADLYSLEECSRFVAERQTLEQLQELFPAILFTEDKVSELVGLWEHCNYKEVFAYCCGSPIVFGIGDASKVLYDECFQIIFREVPWAMSIVCVGGQ